MSTDDHDEGNLYGRGDSPSEERAREHAPASSIARGEISKDAHQPVLALAD